MLRSERREMSDTAVIGAASVPSRAVRRSDSTENCCFWAPVHVAPAQFSLNERLNVCALLGVLRKDVSAKQTTFQNVASSNSISDQIVTWTCECDVLTDMT